MSSAPMGKKRGGENCGETPGGFLGGKDQENCNMSLKQYLY